MHMAVYQPGHQSLPAAIHHRRAVAFDRLVGDFADQIILDQNLKTALDITEGGFEQLEVFKQVLRHAGDPSAKCYKANTFKGLIFDMSSSYCGKDRHHYILGSIDQSVPISAHTPLKPQN